MRNRKHNGRNFDRRIWYVKMESIDQIQREHVNNSINLNDPVRHIRYNRLRQLYYNPPVFILDNNLFYNRNMPVILNILNLFLRTMGM